MLKGVILGLLAAGPAHGYELRQSFESLLAGMWPLNIGQVYATLGRLERDGLVQSSVVEQDAVPDRKVYELTELGAKELDGWLGSPSDEPVHLKNDLFLKALLHEVLGRADRDALIGDQRTRHLQRLRELRALRRSGGLTEVTKLLVDAAVLHVQADLRWLEVWERHVGETR